MIKLALLLFAGILASTASSAWAVSGVGSAIRVDKDPGGSTYKFGLFSAARTPVGGFAVGWEEDSNAANGIERLRYRLFKADGTPVAVPGLANIAGHSAPAFSRIVPIGASSVFFAYTASLPPPALDDPGKREAFGQVITVATGVASGGRRLLNTTNNEGQTTLRLGYLSDGRAVAGWYDDSNYTTIPGRFVNTAGVPQAVSLQFACCQQAQLIALDALGTGFLGTFRRISFLQNFNEIYGRIFKSNGAPLNGPKKLAIASNDLGPGLRALANGKILFFHTVPSGSTYRLVAQLYTQTWQPSGGQKVLNANTAQTVVFTITPTLDGGVLFARNQHVGSTYSLVIQHFNASLNPVGTSFTIATDNPDSVRLSVLSANRAVAVFHKTVAGRQAILAQLISY